MKKVLVTGAAGFIGSHLVQQLTEKGIRVKAAVMPRESTRNIDEFQPTIVRGENLCVAAMKGCTRHTFHFDTQGHRLIADIQIKLS